MTQLAQADDLAAYLQQTFDSDQSAQADAYLVAASAFIVSLCGQDFSQMLADVQTVNPLPGRPAFAELPDRPVTAVELVEVLTPTGWVAVDSSAYVVNRSQGIITARDWSPMAGHTFWPRDPESWRVTYDHGYATVPDAVKSAVVELAANRFATSSGIKSERLDDYSVTFADTDLSPTTLAALQRGGFMSPVIR